LTNRVPKFFVDKQLKKYISKTCGFFEGLVLSRRKVVLAACRACRAVPLRREVPRGVCPEAQEGHAGCLSSWSCCAFASGGSSKGVSRGAGRSCWLPVALFLRQIRCGPVFFESPTHFDLVLKVFFSSNIK